MVEGKLVAPSYDELASFVVRLANTKCDEYKRCEKCPLFFSGFCQEALQLAKRIDKGV